MQAGDVVDVHLLGPACRVVDREVNSSLIGAGMEASGRGVRALLLHEQVGRRGRSERFKGERVSERGGGRSWESGIELWVALHSAYGLVQHGPQVCSCNN